MHERERTIPITGDSRTSQLTILKMFIVAPSRESSAKDHLHGAWVCQGGLLDLLLLINPLTYLPCRKPHCLYPRPIRSPPRTRKTKRNVTHGFLSHAPDSNRSVEPPDRIAPNRTRTASARGNPDLNAGGSSSFTGILSPSLTVLRDGALVLKRGPVACSVVSGFGCTPPLRVALVRCS